MNQEEFVPVKPRLTRTFLRSYLSFTVTIGMLGLVGILFFATPRKGVSMIEKRKLCRFPDFSFASLWQGSYTDSIDLFFADNFPARDPLVGMATQIKKIQGIQSSEFTLVTKKQKALPTGGGIGAFASQSSSELAPAMNSLTDSSATAKASTDSLGAPDEVGEMNHNLFIYKGMGLDLFGGSPNKAKNYAIMLNELAENYKPQVRIFNIVIPTHSEFALPEKYKNLSKSQKNIIDVVSKNLSQQVIDVPAYQELNNNRNQYLYFNTDHHWTVRGAFCAYTAYCRSAGLPVPDITKLKRSCKKHFIGSFYNMTQDSRLSDNEDSVEYYVIPGVKQTVKAISTKNESGTPAKLIYENTGGPHSYGVFLGGDIPILRTDTEVKNGKKVLILKNSYGNAFAPFLALNYEQVFIIDYRYYNGKVDKLISKYGINDVIILQNVFFLNSSYHVGRIKKLLSS